MYPAGWFHGGRRSIRGIVGKEFGLETMIPRGLERGEGGKSPAGHLLAFPRIRAQKRRILSSVRAGRPASGPRLLRNPAATEPREAASSLSPPGA